MRASIELLNKNVKLLSGGRTLDRLSLHALPSVLARIFLGESLSRLGEFDKGTAFALEGLQIANTADHLFSALGAESIVGIIHLRRGDLESAIPHLERAVSICRDHSNLAWLRSAICALGFAYALVGHSETQSVLEEAEAWGRNLVRQDMAAELSHAHLVLGQIDRGTQIIDAALDGHRNRDERGYGAGALYVLGEIEFTRGNAKAERHYRQAMAQANELGFRPLVADCHAGLAKTYGRIGNHTEFKNHFQTAATMYRDMQMAYWLNRMQTEVANVSTFSVTDMIMNTGRC